MPTKKKDKKRKGKKRAAAKRLPSAVQGLLQYLGGQDATLQQTPRLRGAASADGGDTLSRYLAAKTEALNAVRQQQSGIALSQQLEQQYMAKRAAEDTEKKIAMLSAGLKESDKDKKKAIAELSRKAAELEGVVKQQGVEQLFKSLREQYPQFPQGVPDLGSLSGSTPSFSSGYTPPWAGQDSSVASGEYDPFAIQPDFSFGPNFAPQYVEGSQGISYAINAPAAEMYMENQPMGRPVIRDKPKRGAAGGGGAARSRVPQVMEVASGAAAVARSKKPIIPVEAKAAGISAADLRDSIAQATGVAKSRIKLPPRGKYAAAQSVLSSGSGSSADVISALKELGITLAEKPIKV